jgi:hypothetical protein
MIQEERQKIINDNKRMFLELLQPLQYGVTKIYKNNTNEHELLKEKLVNLLTFLGHDVLSEVKLKKPYHGRPDILVMDIFPAVAIEIVNSETEESLLRKSVNYGNIKIVTVRV